MYHYKMKPANDEVGHSALRAMAEWGETGTRDLWDVAMLTYWPVVQHLFGAETFSPALSPNAIETLWAYDEDFKQVANGMPRSMFPEMEARAKEISNIFETAIEKGAHLSEGCPLMHARLGVMDDPDHSKVSAAQKARFMFSVFWASQGNTIPGTFWMLALVVGDPEVRRKATEEARRVFRDAPVPGAKAGFDTSLLPYITACVKETLRMKVTLLFSLPACHHPSTGPVLSLVHAMP